MTQEKNRPAKPNRDRDEPPGVTVCAWCGKVRDERGRWHNPPPGFRIPSRVSHAICPPCLEGQKAELGGG